MAFDLGKYRTDVDALKGLSPEQQVFALNRIYPDPSSDSQLFGDFLKGQMDRLEKLNTPEALRERLAIASEFDERRMREAGKYKALFDLPQTLINAYSVPAQIQAQGAASIAQMMAQGAQNIPNLTSYQRAGFSFTPNRYF